MHLALGIGIAILAAGILGYAFRGKEHAVIQEASAEAKKVEGEVKSKL